MNVGAELRRAREARGVSLARLATTTRIQARVLEALERNDLSGAPPRPYARGFVAAYAREVGLDPDTTVQSYFAQFDHRSDPAPPDDHPGAAAVPENPPVRTWLLPVAAVAAAAVLVITLIAASQGLHLPFSRDAVPQTAVVQGSTASEASPVGTSGVTRQAPVTPASLASPMASSSTDERLTATPAGSADLQASGELRVTLLTDAPAWIAATVDGTRQLYEVVEAGSTHTLRVRRALVLRIGDAGAVRWSINGREAVPMGRRGEVRDVRLTPGEATAAQ